MGHPVCRVNLTKFKKNVSIPADDENLLYSKRITKKVLPTSKIVKIFFFSNYFPFYALKVIKGF